jgi:hypothetical protein
MPHRQMVQSNGKAFARTQWENWSPPGWFSYDDFERTAKSFENFWLFYKLGLYDITVNAVIPGLMDTG